MYIKGHKKTVGIPAATVRVVAGVPEIFMARRVVLLLKRESDGTVISSLRLSVAETRALAHDMLAKADDAERAAEVEQRVRERAGR
jgi:hypothetical protein